MGPTNNTAADFTYRFMLPNPKSSRTLTVPEKRNITQIERKIDHKTKIKLKLKDTWYLLFFKKKKIKRQERTAAMVSYVSALLYGVGGIVMAGMALLVAFQEKLVYVPVLPGLTKSYPITPARLRLMYEDVWLQSSDGVRLHAWFIKLFPDCRGPIQFF